MYDGIKIIFMEKKSLVTFNEQEIESLNSEKELLKVVGDRNILTELLESIGIDVDNNCSSGGCNNCNY